MLSFLTTLFSPDEPMSDEYSLAIAQGENLHTLHEFTHALTRGKGEMPPPLCLHRATTVPPPCHHRRNHACSSSATTLPAC